MNNSINLTEIREYLIELVKEATEIIKKYYDSGEFTSKSKGGVDFLTQADAEVDKFLRESIQKKYPEAHLLTEETAPDDYSTLKDAENLFVIDPIDGTVNFSRHHPHFAISIGLVDKGIPKLGVVCVPIEGDLYYTQEDLENAFLNDQPIHVSKTADLKETVLACDWGWNLETRLKTVEWLRNIVPAVRQVKCMGSAVADLANLASAKMDVYLHSGLKPWDTAASSLLIEKAGGKITTPDGGKWNIFEAEMLTANPILHQKILELINK